MLSITTTIRDSTRGLSLATLTTLADRCGEVHQSYSDFVMLGALLAACGSEISGLQVGNIDWDQRIVTIRRQTYPGAGGLVTKQTKGATSATSPSCKPSPLCWNDSPTTANPTSDS